MVFTAFRSTTTANRHQNRHRNRARVAAESSDWGSARPISIVARSSAGCSRPPARRDSTARGAHRCLHPWDACRPDDRRRPRPYLRAMGFHAPWPTCRTGRGSVRSGRA